MKNANFIFNKQNIKNTSLVFFLSFFVMFFSFGQNNKSGIDNISSANHFYNQKEYSKAEKLFEKIYRQEKSSKVYTKYLDCLIKLSKFEDAISLVKNYYKKTGKNPSVLIDLGEIYILKNEETIAEKKFLEAMEEIKIRPNFILSVASNFYKKQFYKYALEAYLLAKEKNPNSNYSFQICNIYSQLGQIENYYKEFLSLLEKTPSYLQTCKNRIARTISSDSENKNNVLLKRLLIKSLQKNESEILNNLLVWLYLQEKNFTNALDLLVAIDKRNGFYEHEIFDLGEIAISNLKFDIAQEAFNYLIEKGEHSIYYQESLLKIMDVKYLIFQKNPIKKKSEIEVIIKDFKTTIDLLGVKNETILIIKNLAHVLAFYQKNIKEAKQILTSILNKKNYSIENLAYIKIELGDILISENNIWDGILYYSQVEKEFKNDIIGQEAKFKKVQVDYYNGDFNWAQAQLDVLKKSTSKLISNNAIELSLLITDNLNLDTTQTALSLYAKAELLMFQKNYNEATKLFNNIQTLFPSHTLIDEILFKKATIEIEKKEYDKALDYLNQICEIYASDSILFDDALYQQAYILETIIQNKKKAKEKYKQLLIEQPGSIFLAQARKRYRKLRSEIR